MAIIISGKVNFNMTKTNDDVKEYNICIIPTEESLTALKKICNEKIDNPIKTAEDGTVYIKTHSKYEVKVYSDGVETEDIDISEIGACSAVQLAINIKDGKFKGKPYQSAYLKAINVLELVPAEEFNPFA